MTEQINLLIGEYEEKIQTIQKKIDHIDSQPGTSWSRQDRTGYMTEIEIMEGFISKLRGLKGE